MACCERGLFISIYLFIFYSFGNCLFFRASEWETLHFFFYVIVLFRQICFLVKLISRHNAGSISIFQHICLLNNKTKKVENWKLVWHIDISLHIAAAQPGLLVVESSVCHCLASSSSLSFLLFCLFVYLSSFSFLSITPIFLFLRWNFHPEF